MEAGEEAFDNPVRQNLHPTEARDLHRVQEIEPLCGAIRHSHSGRNVECPPGISQREHRCHPRWTLGRCRSGRPDAITQPRFDLAYERPWHALCWSPGGGGRIKA